jgi:hypothetical protein
MKKDFSNSSFYQKLQKEHEEIQKLKWIESEKARHDIGIERAILIWVKNHRDKWLKENS